MSEELDFREEARNADKLREMLRRSGDAEARGGEILVQIPRVFPSLSSSRVLTQEWCDGVRVVGLHKLNAVDP
jgi:predicted unusual protein kinase regulating ubiquinone biosynthesis (AarF/ABC1/UbiB family)